MFLQSVLVLLMHIQHCSSFSYTLQTNLDLPLNFRTWNICIVVNGVLTYSVRNTALPSWCPWSCLCCVLLPCLCFSNRPAPLCVSVCNLCDPKWFCHIASSVTVCLMCVPALGQTSGAVFSMMTLLSVRHKGGLL